MHFQPIVLLQQRLLTSRVLRLWPFCLNSAVPTKTIVKHAVASHSRRSSGLCIFMEWTMLKSKFEFHRLWRSLHPPGCCAINDVKRFLQDAYATRLAIQHASPHTTWCRAFLKARAPPLLPRHYRVADMMQFLSAMNDSWYVSMITSWRHRVQLYKVTPAPQASLQSSTQLPPSQPPLRWRTSFDGLHQLIEICRMQGLTVVFSLLYLFREREFSRLRGSRSVFGCHVHT